MEQPETSPRIGARWFVVGVIALAAWNVIGDVDGPLFPMILAGDSPIRTLADESVLIADGTIRIVGLSLPASRGNEDPRAVLSRETADSTEEEFVIVAGHAPDFVMAMDGQRLDLGLAGHTHGGQVRVPWLGPIVTLSRVPRDWARGFRQQDGWAFNVSAGIGAEHLADLPNIRFNCPPEITLIRVEPAQ